MSVLRISKALRTGNPLTGRYESRSTIPMTYKSREKELATDRIYNHSPRGREVARRYSQSAKGKKVTRLKRIRRAMVNRQIIAAAKNVPCADCGNIFPPRRMHFHHLRDKTFNIGGRLHYTAEKIKAEIAKCIVLCISCHARRHKLAALGTQA